MAIELFSSDVLRVFPACVLHASKAMCRDRHVFFLWVSKVTFREFFWLVFCMLRARILLLFEAFGGGFPRPCAVRDMFFMDSKGDVPRVFQGAFADGFPRPCAAIDMFFMDSKGDVPRIFQACVLTLRPRIRLLFEAFGGSFPRQFSKAVCRDVSRVFQACVLHASGTNPAAVRGFRRRFSKAMCREKHVFYGFQT